MRRGRHLSLLCCLLFVFMVSVGDCVEGFSLSTQSALRIDVEQGQPSWSADGIKIAYKVKDGTSSDVFVMDADGSSPINLTQGRFGFREVGIPKFSPDGTKVVFVVNSDIFVMNSDGSNPINITEANPSLGTEPMRSSPTWSPDGTKIAFATNHPDEEPRTTEGLLFVMDVDGKNKIILFDNPNSTAAIVDPAWSPDGSKIAFARAGNLHAVNARDGSDFTLLLSRDRDGRIREPAWSPDGTKIAYRVDTTKDIYVMSLFDGNIINLTNDNHDNSRPTWSSDGTIIAYGSDREDSSGIYAIKSDGSDVNPNEIAVAGRFAGNPDSYGAKANPTGDAIGGGHGYSKVVTAGDFEVSTRDELLVALNAAQADQIIYVLPDSKIDLSGHSNIDLPRRVTLAGNRGVDGSRGPVIYTDQKDDQYTLFQAWEGARITGIRLRGPDGEIGGDSSARWETPNYGGIKVIGTDVKIDNNEIYNWSWYGIDVRNVDAHIHHNYIHHVQRAGLGYPVVVSGGTALIESNYFDWYRHAIASTGYPGSGYEARYNIVGPNAISFAFDMHGGRDFCAKKSPPCTNVEKFMAGDWIDIHHNTFMNVKTGAVGIRGAPLEGAKIYKNWFYHDEYAHFPVELLWIMGNVDIYDNVYGSDRHRVGWEMIRSPVVRECPVRQCLRYVQYIDEFPMISVLDPLKLEFAHPQSGPSPIVVQGEFPVDVAVEVHPFLDVEGIEIRIGQEVLFSGKTPPHTGDIRLNTLVLDDGNHALTLEVFLAHQPSFKIEQLIRVNNRWDMTDSLEAPQEMGWFGTVDLSKTSEASSGWTYTDFDKNLYPGDIRGRVRSDNTTEFLTWEANKLANFTAVMYFEDAQWESDVMEETVLFDVLHESEWVSIPYRLNVEESSNGWFKVIATGVVCEDLVSDKFRLTIAEDLPANKFVLGEMTLGGLN